MASGKIIQDIDEKFLQCPICMEQLKEPKILPCLHRYCRNCLAGTVTGRARDVQCPTCREIHTLPPKGVDGFKSDFNTKNIIEFVQSRHPVKHETKKRGPPRVAPMCHNHPGKLLEVFCASCGNQPICISCIIGGHKGHDIQEVSSLAKIEKNKLTKKIAELERYREKIYNRQEEVKTVKRKLHRAVNAKKDELQEEFDLKENEIKRVIRDGNKKLEQQREELDKILERNISQRRQQLGKEMKDAKEKYDECCEEERQKTDSEFRKLQDENEKDEQGIRQKLEGMNQGIKDLLTSLHTQEEENSKKIKELSDHFEDIVKRFENLTATALSILAAKDDWTYVQGIPDICSAIDFSIEEARREFPELEILSDITVGDLSLAIPGRGVCVNITEREESDVNIEGVTGRGWGIDCITGSKDGCIVITGRASGSQSHITVINTKGKKVKQDIMKSTSMYGYRYCNFLSQYTIATVSWYNEIGIYDVRDGTYIKTNISDVTSSWPSCRFVSCVAIDHVSNHIIVGGSESRDVYVFNRQLEYINKLTLITWPVAMTVHESGNLLVCDHAGGAYVVTMGGSFCELMHEFTKPDVDGGVWKPWSVCTDKNGFIYMLWRGNISDQGRSILVQYSRDGRQLLQTRLLDCKDPAFRITTADTEQGEKILIATDKTGKLITNSLVKSAS